MNDNEIQTGIETKPTWAFLSMRTGTERESAGTFACRHWKRRTLSRRRNFRVRTHTHTHTYRGIRAALITAGPTAGTAAYNVPRRFIYHARTRKSPGKWPRAAPLGTPLWVEPLLALFKGTPFSLKPPSLIDQRSPRKRGREGARERTFLKRASLNVFWPRVQ